MKHKFNISMDYNVYVMLRGKTDNISGTLEQLAKAYIDSEADKIKSNIEDIKLQIYKLQAELAIQNEKHEKELKELEKKNNEVEYIQRPEAKTRLQQIEELGEEARRKRELYKGGWWWNYQ